MTRNSVFPTAEAAEGRGGGLRDKWRQVNGRAPRGWQLGRGLFRFIRMPLGSLLVVRHPINSIAQSLLRNPRAEKAHRFRRRAAERAHRAFENECGLVAGHVPERPCLQVETALDEHGAVFGLGKSEFVISGDSLRAEYPASVCIERVGSGEELERIRLAVEIGIAPGAAAGGVVEPKLRVCHCARFSRDGRSSMIQSVMSWVA